MRRFLHVLASLSLVACVSKSDYDAAKAALSQTQAQLAHCQDEANAERGAATMKLAETEMALRDSKAVEQRLLVELRQAKGSVDAPTTTPALPSYPVVDALAQLLKPKAKHLKKEVDTEPGESYWVVDEGTVPNGTVMLSRLKADPAGLELLHRLPRRPRHRLDDPRLWQRRAAVHRVLPDHDRSASQCSDLGSRSRQLLRADRVVQQAGALGWVAVRR